MNKEKFWSLVLILTMFVIVCSGGVSGALDTDLISYYAMEQDYTDELGVNDGDAEGGTLTFLNSAPQLENYFGFWDADTRQRLSNPKTRCPDGILD